MVAGAINHLTAILTLIPGFYIEFISFVNDDPALREGHWWGNKKYGIIDFALTSRSDDGPVLFSRLEDRLSHLNLGEGISKVQYQHPVEGGRVRPDGREIGWHVTFPIVNSGYQRGELPFFCTDLTPREFRAPISKENTTHPNGAYGVDELYVFVPEETAIVLAQAYSAILGVPNSVNDEDPNFLGTFELTRLHEVPGTDGPVIVIGMPLDEEQSAAMEERGGILLANLTLGSVDESNSLLKRIDLGSEGVGGIVAPVM